MNKKKLLIIEDEESIADLLSYSLEKEGFITKIANEGNKGLDIIPSFNPDLILLDLMLPDISGFDVCKNISKDWSIPVIMLTAKSDAMDKILGIELGADDYITKPFNLREVVARIKSIFRRIELIEHSKETISSDKININKNIEIYVKERKVLKDDVKVDFTTKEFDLLLFFAQNKSIVFSRMELLDKVWGFEFLGDTRTVDIHVQRIRKKLDQNKNDSIIETVFGIGYKFVG